MDFAQLLTPTRTLANARASSYKAALEVLSELLSKEAEDTPQSEFLHALVARERLGSTNLGYGIAIPHARIDDISTPMAALIRLNNTLDYDSDKPPVDILMAVVFPQRCTDNHRALLNAVTTALKDPALVDCLRAAKTSNELFDCFTQHMPSKISSAHPEIRA